MKASNIVGKHASCIISHARKSGRAKDLHVTTPSMLMVNYQKTNSNGIERLHGFILFLIGVAAIHGGVFLDIVAALTEVGCVLNAVDSRIQDLVRAVA